MADQYRRRVPPRIERMQTTRGRQAEQPAKRRARLALLAMESRNRLEEGLRRS